MKVKIDTKEKMYVVKVEEQKLTANMTEELKNILLDFLNKPMQNVIVNFLEVNELDLKTADVLASIQQRFYEENHSMVFCHFNPAITEFLDKNEVLELLNTTPTESEAWDIVQMEEVEREYL